MPSQTIRRKIDTETYEDLASGDRSFVVVTAQEDAQPDDYFVFVEQKDGKDGREVYRKVTLVVEVEDTDVLIAGLVPVEYQALEGIFKNNNTLVAYGVEKRDGNITVIDQPAFLPVLAAPEVDPHQTNDFLGVATWPDGQYSIMLKCTMTPVDNGQQDVTVTEHLVMCRTLREYEDEELDIFIQLDHRFLMAGALKDAFGNEVVAHLGELRGETDAEYEYDEDEADADPDDDHETSLDGATEADAEE